MGDNKATLTKARQELEELYLGVPDESVNLTFQDLAQLNITQQQQQQQNVVFDMKKKPIIMMDPIQEREGRSSGLGKSTSLDFTKGMQSPITIAQDDDDYKERNYTAYSSSNNNNNNGRDKVYGKMPNDNMARRNMGLESTLIACDEKGGMMTSVGYMSPYEERGGRPRRAGIPHSNICTICSNYIYIFRHRCLVCGRVYCRSCVSVGMGEMTEGRKCIQCLGRRFSQRYIERAGQTGCCMGYRSMVKQQELLWAEKGPRRSGFNGEGRSSALYGRSSGMISRSSTTPVPRTPTSSNLMHLNAAISSSGSPSFVMAPTSAHNSPRYSPILHSLPL